MSAPVVSDQANWRDELTPEARKEAKNFLVSKLQRNIPRDKLLPYSHKHEGLCYDKATSISNYILLVCEPVDTIEYQLQQKQAAKAAQAAKQRAAAGEQTASSTGQVRSTVKPGVQMSSRPKAQQAQAQARNDLNGLQNIDHEQRGSGKMEPSLAVQNSQYAPDSAGFYPDAQAPKMTSQMNPNVMRQSGVSPQQQTQQQSRMQPRQMVQQQQQPQQQQPRVSAQAQQPPQQQQQLAVRLAHKNIGAVIDTAGFT
uniref:Mediator complex subunit 15 KIX domain-containing protein n=1 Tax=Rhodosorus marinus TaxID=101924 RepID=A0A7S3E829_9RHOD|mmetsp:Transcript_13562/g.54398  ORF Transcript_13562/g.54398 Transcript_13562/m.54398 type:complete len:255 (+) Transcript_13562:601-1365(+)